MKYVKPNPLKDTILKLMSDGKPRTTSDICNVLKRTSRIHRNATVVALKAMTENGVLTKDNSLNIDIWELPKESLRNGTSR